MIIWTEHSDHDINYCSDKTPTTALPPLLPVINPPTSGPNALLRHSTFTEIMVEQEKLHKVDVIQITAAIS